MRFIRLQNAALALSLLTAAGMAVVTTAPVAYAQTAVTGGIGGVVADSTGGVVPGATVTIVNAGTNTKLTLKTNEIGRYTASNLAPGTYNVTAAAPGLQSNTMQITVLVGTTATADVKVTPSASNSVIEVSASTLPLVDTQNVALATTFNLQQIQSMPTPGGDVTTFAFTAPGVVVNAGGSYGNFSSDGLPGISNLFVMNGFDNQDPFLNLNNSGSSNLTLGQGELAEVTVIQNGYNSQYGRAAGAIINYVTKSGTNQFHGFADYTYNGTTLNANSWFDNYFGEGRPHAVSNEWAANVGGPIIKDKLFFFADYEGLRYVLPGANGLVNFPTPQFQAATLANIPAAQQPFYQQAFALYQKAPLYSSATPVSLSNGQGGCGTFTGASGSGFGTTTPCIMQAYESVDNINKEWLFTGRADWNISDNHRIYGRYKMDRGSQPTGTSFINPAFSTTSIQPEYEGQFNDTYTINQNKTNVFVAAANWYTAYFGPSNISAAQQVFPWYFAPDTGLDGSGSSQAAGLATLGVPNIFPQGRNVTQYQFEDDFSWTRGKHSIKFGVNFRRDLISDYDAQAGVDFPYAQVFGLSGLYAGSISSATKTNPATGEYQQNFANQTTAHLALYNLGLYVQDEWQVRPNLKLTFGARVDRTGNPLCHNGCYSAYQGTFPASGASMTQPYLASAGGSINPQNWNAFPNVDVLNFQPRVGFNYSIDDKTEIRGGAGLFSDLYPGVILDGFIQNFPNVNQVTVQNGNIAPNGQGSIVNNASAANTALQAGFTSGQSMTQINNTLEGQGINTFVPPSINAYAPGRFHTPIYLEYSLQLQRQLTPHDAIILTYAGNYGYNELMVNSLLNGATGVFNGNGDNQWDNVLPSLQGASVTPADPSFSTVNAYTNNAHSNYNGGMVTYKHIDHGITAQVTYTYSHALDMISNGGTGGSEPYNSGSVNGQLTPTLGYGNLNYSNADYDIRNNLVADVVYEEPHIKGHKYIDQVAGGWVIGGKTYYRSGEPFSIFNGALAGAGYTNFGSTPQFMAQTVSGTARNLVNTTISNPHAAVAASGLGDCTQFVGFDSLNSANPCGGDANVTQGTFGNLARNSLYGPHYVDTDINLSKKIINFDRFAFQIGADAYNLFNHPNFGNPNSTLGQSNFGTISTTNGPPTSPYGSFSGLAQRMLAVHGKITF